MPLLTMVFEIQEDDIPTETAREYREVVLMALRQLEHTTPEEERMRDKLLYDAYRTEAAEYNEDGIAQDNIADEID